MHRPGEGFEGDGGDGAVGEDDEGGEAEVEEAGDMVDCLYDAGGGRGGGCKQDDNVLDASGGRVHLGSHGPPSAHCDF